MKYNGANKCKFRSLSEIKWQGQMSSTCKAMVDHNDPRTREKVMYHNLPPNLSPKLYNY